MSKELERIMMLLIFDNLSASIPYETNNENVLNFCF